MRRTPATKPGKWLNDGSRHFRMPGLDAYVCASCNYGELWARDISDLVHSPDEGVHLIDADAMGSGSS
jgi:hypothetical protein